MRDPNRIEPFLKELGNIWRQECPDQRFGQFIFNTFDALGGGICYHTEDDQMMKDIKTLYGRGRRRKNAR